MLPFSNVRIAAAGAADPRTRFGMARGRPWSCQPTGRPEMGCRVASRSSRPARFGTLRDSTTLRRPSKPYDGGVGQCVPASCFPRGRRARGPITLKRILGACRLTPGRQFQRQIQKDATPKSAGDHAQPLLKLSKKPKNRRNGLGSEHQPTGRRPANWILHLDKSTRGTGCGRVEWFRQNNGPRCCSFMAPHTKVAGILMLPNLFFPRKARSRRVLNCYCDRTRFIGWRHRFETSFGRRTPAGGSRRPSERPSRRLAGPAASSTCSWAFAWAPPICCTKTLHQFGRARG